MTLYKIRTQARTFQTTDTDAAEQYSRNGARVTARTSE